jgi:hypothetical protein
MSLAMDGMIHSLQKQVLELKEEVVFKEKIVNEVREEMRLIKSLLLNQRKEFEDQREEASDEKSKLQSKVSQNHREAIQSLKNEGYFKTTRVFEALLCVDYADFSCGNALQLSSTVYYMEKMGLQAKEGMKVLAIDLDPYQVVCLCLMVGPQGSVVALNNNNQRICLEATTSRKYNWLIESGRLVIVTELEYETRIKGCPDLAPYSLALIHDLTFVRLLSEQVIPSGQIFSVTYEKLWKKKSDGSLKEIKLY